MSELFTEAFDLLSLAWWIVIPLLVFVAIRDFWLVRAVTNYLKSLEWVTLEFVIPRENIKPIRAMEQVFVSLHGTYSFGIPLSKRFFKGVVEDWMSLEIVGHAGGVRFYIRAQKKYRNLVESAIFSQYPDAEIREVEDYTSQAPRNLPDSTYDIWGADYILAREDAYPLRTYKEFEELTRSERDEEKKTDPIATIAEVMSNLKKNEMIWLQLVIRPTGGEWREKAKGVIEEVLGKKSGGGGLFGGGLGEFFQNLLNAPFQHPQWSGGGDSPSPPPSPTPGKQEILKAVENKTSKLAFEGLLRFIYIDVRSEFTGENVSAVLGALRQFGTPHINSLAPNMKTITIPKLTSKLPWRRKQMLLRRKKQLFRAYVERALPQKTMQAYQLKLKTSIFSTEELATLFHPPISAVRAPRLHPVEARKGSPPVDLPIKREP